MTTVSASPTSSKPPALMNTNQWFLQLIFGSRWGEAHCTAFWADPNVNGRWMGWRAGAELRRLENGARNTYFTISLFRDNAKGQASRSKKLFQACYVIVADDVGTKVDPAKLAGLGEPTYRLETSPGNYQYGYKLDLPELDRGRVDALLNGMIAGGLAADGRDPGMKGVTRYVRLPQGTNRKAKYGPDGFACRLVSVNPGRTFTMQELADFFGIILPAPGETPIEDLALAPGQEGPANTPTGAQHDRQDVILELMREMGHVRHWIERDGFRAWDCECPCIDEHTDGVDSGCAYVPQTGTWVCFHGHCSGTEGSGKPRPWPEYYAGLERKLAVLGMAPMRQREFPELEDDPDAGQDDAAGLPRVSTVARFLRDMVFMKPENAFLDLRAGTLVGRPAVNLAWAPLLGEALEYETDKGETRQMPVDKWFFGQGGRQVADRQTYWPGKPRFFEDKGVAFANNYAPGHWIDPGRRVRNAEVGPWLRLVRHVMQGEDMRAMVFLLDWMALVVSEPGTKPGATIMVHGLQGIGKDMLLNPVLWAVGAGNGAALPGSILASEFTGWAARRLVQIKELKSTTRGAITSHDAYARLKWAGDKSPDWIEINPKGQAPYQARNVVALYITTNEEDAAQLATDDRRIFVVGSKATKLDPDFYADLVSWLTGDGNRLVQSWLRQRWARVTDKRRAAQHGNAPPTQGKLAMLAAVRDPVEAWLADRMEDDATPDWPDVVSAEQIVGLVSRASSNGQDGLAKNTRTPSAAAVGRMLANLGATRLAGGAQVRVRGKKERLWAIRRGAVLDMMPLRELVELRSKGAGAEFVETGDVVPFRPSAEAGAETPSETS